MNNDTFQWNDALVKEYLDTRLGDTYKDLEDFKRSKQRPLIGVLPEWLWKETRLKELKDAIVRYQSNNIVPPKEWVKELGELSMWLANRKYAADKKEWGIEDCFDNKGNRKSWHPYDKGCNDLKCEIRSVRRLSDNEVFTVGDMVEKPMKGTIKFFQGFPSGSVHVNIKGVNDIDEYSGSGNDLLKSTPAEQPKKERIEVKDVGIESMLIKFEGRRLSVGKIEQVKAAIERVLNDEDDDTKIYTKEDHDILIEAAQSAAFNAAREPYCETAMGQRPKYWTFQDYINHQRDKK